MDRDRYLDTAAAWLLARDSIALRRVAKLPAAADPEFDSLRERAADLTDSAALDAIVEELSDSPDGSIGARSLELVVDAVGGLLTTAAAEPVARLRAETVVDDGGVGVGFETLESWAARRADPASPVSGVDRIEAATERIGAAEEERAAALRSIESEGRLPPAEEVGGRARCRPPALVAGWARALVDAAVPLLPPGSQHVGGLPGWLALPVRLGRQDLAGAVPPPDDQLLAFVCERLGVDRLLEHRIALDLADRPGKAGRDLVARAPNRSVILAARRSAGRLRDYRGLLRLLGRALAAAGLERTEGMAAYRADPALGFAYGALLEGQLLRPAWHERVLRGRVPAAVMEAWRLQGIHRTARRAAEVIVGDRAGASGHPAVPPVATRDRSAELPFVAPVGVMPSSGPLGEARDELTGRLVADALDDLLARRWGSAWSLEPAAGALLRDLWAAGHATVSALCADLGLDPPSCEPALERWRAGTP